MISKGQIVEIPATSSLYKRVAPAFASRKDFLVWKSQKRIYTLFDGFLVGEHSGVEHFKIGQRKGISVGGKKEPLYVLSVDEKENRLFVGAGENHPGLWNDVFSFDKNQIHWHNDQIFNPDTLEAGISVQVLSPVLHEKVTAKLYGFNDVVFLEFEKPVRSVIRDHVIQIIHNNIQIADINN